MLRKLASFGALCLFSTLSVALPSAQAQEAGSPLAAAPPAAEQGDVLAVINGSPDYSIFAGMLQRSGLASILNGQGPFTVFMPTNAAFSSLPAGTVDQLLLPQNKARLAELVTDHILPGAITSDSWDDNSHLGIALGGSTLVYARGQYEQVNNAPVVAKDIRASNGVVHAINGLLSVPQGN